MTNPVLYDFRKTIRSKTVVFMLIAMVLFAGAILVIVNSGPGLAATSAGVRAENAELWDYYTGTGYHFLGYAFNQYGAPMAGVTFKITANANGGATYNAQGVTNASGWASFAAQIPGSIGAGITFSATDSSGNSVLANGQQGQSQLQQYQNMSAQGGSCNGSCITGVQPLNGNPVSVVIDPANASSADLAVSELGPGGAPPTNWGVYYLFTNTQLTQTAVQALTPSKMQLLGRLDGVLTILPMFPSTTMGYIAIGVFDGSGHQIWASSQPVQNFQAPNQQQTNYLQRFGGFFTSVDSSSNQSQTALLFSELGQNGSIPSNWGVYYKFTASIPSQVALQALTPSEMLLLGRLNGVTTVLPVPNATAAMKDVVLAVFTPQGKQIDVWAGSTQNAWGGYPPWAPGFWEYTTASAYNFLGYATDQFGAPLSGANVTVSLTVGTSTYDKTVLTNSSGLASFDIVAPTSGGASLQAIITSLNPNLQPWSSQNGLPGYTVPQVSWGANFWGFATASSYHFIGLATDQYGKPLAGVNCNISVTVGSSAYGTQLVTNSSGYVSYVLKASTSGNAGVQVTMTPADASMQPWSQESGIQSFQSQQGGQSSLGSVQSLYGNEATPVLDPSNVTRVELLYTRLATNGTAPPETDVYYKYTSVVPSYQQLQELNESEMQFLGTASGFTSILQRPPPGVSNATTIIVGSFTASGALVNIQPSQYTVGTSSSTDLANLLTIDLGFFVPVAGTLVAYGAYGRERLSGVLESILTRPVSRRALAISRYVSVTLTLAVASVVVVEAIAILSGIIIGFSFGVAAQFGLILGTFIEAMAYAGIVFVLSRLLKSTSLVLGLAAGLYLLTNFIPFLMTVGGSLPSWLSYVLPGRYVAMCLQYFLNFSLSGAAIAGVTAFTIAGEAFLWLALPFAAFFYLSVKRD